MRTLTVRFIGICMFLDSPDGGGKFAKRVILPVDKRSAQRGDGPHIAYLEFDMLDEPRGTGQFQRVKNYGRERLALRRFHLSGDRITIRNAVQTKGLNVLSTYDERVPALTLVSPDLEAPATTDLFGDTPPPKMAAAFFDIHFGDLHTGPPDLRETKFSEGTKWPTRRLANWIELQVPIKDGEGPVIDVESFGPGGLGKRTIELSPSTDRITIGNQLQKDIERPCIETLSGAMLEGEDFRAHFALYYDLFPPKPDHVLPAATAALVNGCVPVRYP